MASNWKHILSWTKIEPIILWSLLRNLASFQRPGNNTWNGPTSLASSLAIVALPRTPEVRLVNGPLEDLRPMELCNQKWAYRLLRIDAHRFSSLWEVATYLKKRENPVKITNCVTNDAFLLLLIAMVVPIIFFRKISRAVVHNQFMLRFRRAIDFFPTTGKACAMVANRPHIINWLTAAAIF